MCAAPSTVYTGKTFELHNVGVVKYDNLLALKLLEYGSNIKTLFYLDNLFIVKNGSDEGFIGCIETDVNRLNYLIRNPSRFGKGRLRRDTDSKIFIMLNDGGLNTKAFVSDVAPDAEQSVLDIKSGDLFFRSAYYSNTDKYGVRYRTASDAWQESTATGLPAKSDITIGFATMAGVRANTGMEMYGFTQNEEGEFRSASKFILITAGEIFLYLNGVGATYYVSEVPDVGTQLFTDSLLQGLAGPGNYVDYNTSKTYVVDLVGGTYRITQVISAVVPSFNTLTYNNYGSTKAGTCLIIDVDNVMYWTPQQDGNRYYTTQDYDVTKPAGYYRFEESGVVKVILLDSTGLEIAREDC